jgi:hypothetical protein
VDWLTLNAADSNAGTMNQASEMKTLRRERAKKEPSITDLGKFDPDDFNLHEDAFLNLLAQSFGVLRKPLRYIMRPEVTPAKIRHHGGRTDVSIPVNRWLL